MLPLTDFGARLSRPSRCIASTGRTRSAQQNVANDCAGGTPVASKQWVLDHIVERLASIGVGHIFGVDGASIEDLYAVDLIKADASSDPSASAFQIQDPRGTG
jgi:hypothetical protein